MLPFHRLNIELINVRNQYYAIDQPPYRYSIPYRSFDQ